MDIFFLQMKWWVVVYCAYFVLVIYARTEVLAGAAALALVLALLWPKSSLPLAIIYPLEALGTAALLVLFFLTRAHISLPLARPCAGRSPAGCTVRQVPRLVSTRNG
jgi:hypothetical protein